jgi:hypothetical protein
VGQAKWEWKDIKNIIRYADSLTPEQQAHHNIAAYFPAEAMYTIDQTLQRIHEKLYGKEYPDILGLKEGVQPPVGWSCRLPYPLWKKLTEDRFVSEVKLTGGQEAPYHRFLRLFEVALKDQGISIQWRAQESWADKIRGAMRRALDEAATELNGMAFTPAELKDIANHLRKRFLSDNTAMKGEEPNLIQTWAYAIMFGAEVALHEPIYVRIPNAVERLGKYYSDRILLQEKNIHENNMGAMVKKLAAEMEAQAKKSTTNYNNKINSDKKPTNGGNKPFSKAKGENPGTEEGKTKEGGAGQEKEKKKKFCFH